MASKRKRVSDGNLQSVLAGCNLRWSTSCRHAFLTHFKEDYERMNKVYAEYSCRPPPCPTCVGVSGLRATRASNRFHRAPAVSRTFVTPSAFASSPPPRRLTAS
jgi:hypothetical protein